MKISFIEIQNFRKLKSCRVELSEKETVFVGANNSGKTSAMDALMLFLDKSRRKNIATTDFTLSNWTNINKIGSAWVGRNVEDTINFSLESWEPLLPSLDVWIEVDDCDIHYVGHLIPNLDWEGGLLGVRLLLRPKDFEEFFRAFKIAIAAAQNAQSYCESNISLRPQSLREFLDDELHTYFQVCAYTLDPNKIELPENGKAQPQSLPRDSAPLDREPFDGLFKIDIINAQRGFSDPNAEENTKDGFGKLSTQLRNYFEKHLNPTDFPGPEDVEALEAIEQAREVFDIRLKKSFKPAISELEGLNYPGFSDPIISLTCKINPVESLNHKTGVQFSLLQDGTGGASLSLPEKYNGLGYQNLISMVFNLIRFRDNWLRIGKARKKQKMDNGIVEPLHIVLIEEPEAHLHAQVQQVFMKKAYAVLRNHESLAEGEQNETQVKLSTQMIVSTHSSHIAHEVDFGCLRYFRREPSTSRTVVPIATVVNLSTTFGTSEITSQFAKRYLKATHCDLFFADAAILIEGAAERMLLPHFIRYHYTELDKRYISLLEICGSHAHCLKPLIETLGLLTLIVTDIDSIGKESHNKVRPKRGLEYRTGNNTLKSWVPEKEKLDELLDLPDVEKITHNGSVRVSYQCPIDVKHNSAEEKQEALPYTFEDSLALTNNVLFGTMTTTKGLLGKMSRAQGKSNLDETCQAMYDALDGGKKAEMALELLYTIDPKELSPPEYIASGLKWLQQELNLKKQDFIVSGEVAVGGVS